MRRNIVIPGGFPVTPDIKSETVDGLQLGNVLLTSFC